MAAISEKRWVTQTSVQRDPGRTQTIVGGSPISTTPTTTAPKTTAPRYFDKYPEAWSYVPKGGSAWQKPVEPVTTLTPRTGSGATPSPVTPATPSSFDSPLAQQFSGGSYGSETSGGDGVLGGFDWKPLVKWGAIGLGAFLLLRKKV